MGDMTAASRGHEESTGGGLLVATRVGALIQLMEESTRPGGGERRGGGRGPQTVNALASGVKIRLVLCMALSQSSAMIYALELFF